MHSQWWPLNCKLSHRRVPERQCGYPFASLSHCSWMVKKAKIKSRLFRKGRGYKTEKSLYHNISVVQTYFEYFLQFSLQHLKDDIFCQKNIQEKLTKMICVCRWVPCRKKINSQTLKLGKMITISDFSQRPIKSCTEWKKGEGILHQYFLKYRNQGVSKRFLDNRSETTEN